ncbi:FMRFamide receptor [Trichogramma pretiosum]|uniref:FMRFamide receptor n=1 Tax=Trichogramma pretiosum TaxID=7493 RepID=UPI0006C9DC83|nr:FMRFamide receptor [Trichogramma pretiosum]XP_023314916.1 FMRFamide receptor [Trichogramma pretiosum]
MSAIDNYTLALEACGNGSSSSSSQCDDALFNVTEVLVAAAAAANNNTTEDPMLHCISGEGDAFTDFVVYGLLMNCISLLGLLGNCITIIVLSRPQMRSSINYLLIGLATCDTGLIVSSVLIYAIPGLTDYTGLFHEYKHNVFPRIIRYLFPLSTTFQMATVYITLTVTMERYVAVCHPLKARSLCTYSRARWALCAIALFAVSYNVPKLFELEFTETVNSLNKTVPCLMATEMRKDPLYIAIYVHWMYFFVYYTFPFVLIVIFNGLIYNKVRTANRNLRLLSHTQRRELGLATMLLCVVIVFLVCNILPMVSNILENTSHFIPQWILMAGNILVTFNSGINFVIYVIFGRKFKRIFLKLFCPVSAETGLDCMGRSVNRAESPDLQTNDDSIATSHIELKTSTKRGHHGHRGGSQRSSGLAASGQAHQPSLRGGGGLNNGSSSGRSSVYYPSNSLKAAGGGGGGGSSSFRGGHPAGYYNGNQHHHNNNHIQGSGLVIEDTAFC